MTFGMLEIYWAVFYGYPAKIHFGPGNIMFVHLLLVDGRGNGWL